MRPEGPAQTKEEDIDGQIELTKEELIAMASNLRVLGIDRALVQNDTSSQHNSNMCGFTQKGINIQVCSTLCGFELKMRNSHNAQAGANGT